MNTIIQQAIDAINQRYGDWDDGLVTIKEIREILERLPSIEPEYRLDEWCTDCKEYDKEKHHCPRWNKVIRTTLDEFNANNKGQWIWKPVKQFCAPDCWYPPDSLAEETWNEEEGSWYEDKMFCSKCDYQSDIRWNFCPNCGKKMNRGSNGTE